MDIFLQMNTTYYDSDGYEIFKKRKIIAHYMRGMFTIDLLSSLPLGRIGAFSDVSSFHFLCQINYNIHYIFIG